LQRGSELRAALFSAKPFGLVCNLEITEVHGKKVLQQQKHCGREKPERQLG
jgi:hypothetical protein